MSVIEPFPIRHRIRHTQGARVIASQMPPQKAKAYFQRLTNEYRKYLERIGVAPSVIEREMWDLRLALMDPPQPDSGLKLRKAA